MNKKIENGWEKLFQPAFGCAQHPKAGQNTQQGKLQGSACVDVDVCKNRFYLKTEKISVIDSDWNFFRHGDGLEAVLQQVQPVPGTLQILDLLISTKWTIFNCVAEHGTSWLIGKAAVPGSGDPNSNPVLAGEIRMNFSFNYLSALNHVLKSGMADGVQIPSDHHDLRVILLRFC